MDYEPLLTILFALGIAAALIAYAAFPRGRSAGVSLAHAASVGSFASAPVAQTIEVAAVEAPSIPITASVVDVAPSAAEIAPTPVASAIDVSAIAPAQAVEEAVATTAAKPRRTTRKKSTSTKTRARSSKKTTKA